MAQRRRSATKRASQRRPGVPSTTKSPARTPPTTTPAVLDAGSESVARSDLVETVEKRTLGGPNRGFPWLLIVAGGLGFLASFTLILDRIALWKNPDAQLSCSLSATVDCASVMLAPQSEIFGFPNPLLGVPMFAAIVTVGVALVARARFAGWFWGLLALSQVASAGFVAWFIFQTVFRIQRLCPWCSLVWLVTVPLLFYTLAYALAEALPVPGSVKRFGRFLLRWQAASLIVLYAPVVFAIVYEAFLS
jgi:uncharacterized membrane protein